MDGKIKAIAGTGIVFSSFLVRLLVTDILQDKIPAGHAHRDDPASFRRLSYYESRLTYPMPRYLALLRGINVGGKGIVKMPALKSAFESLGFTGVSTYIQSGNVLFSAPAASRVSLATSIERRLNTQFGIESKALILTPPDMQEVVSRRPEAFGMQPDLYRYDVMYLMGGFRPAEIVGDIPAREGVDRVWAGKKVIYFSRLTEQASRSYLPKIITRPVYRHMTVRNWNTTTRLMDLLLQPSP
jgi:uncharacterized protein (DUF1697 family)